MEARNKRVVISISVPAWLAEKISKDSAERNISRSAFVKELFLESYFNSYFRRKNNGSKEGTAHDQY